MSRGEVGGMRGGEAATDLLLWDEGVPGFSSGDCFSTLLPYGNRRRRSGGGGGGGGVISRDGGADGPGGWSGVVGGIPRNKRRRPG